MPKLKTKRAAAKRFKITGSGKVRRHSVNRRHLLTGKSAKRMRQLEGLKTVRRADMGRLRELLPYAGKIK